MSDTVPFDKEELSLVYIDGHNWRVLEPFTFGSQTIERMIRVPAGFVTDFASIPRALWAVLPPTGTYGKAALIHDLLYRTPHEACTRAEADRILLEAMLASRVGFWVSCVIYLAVRVGGRRAFKPRQEPCS